MKSLWAAGLAVVVAGAFAGAVERQSGMKCEERPDRACEIREMRMPPTGALAVDATPNGGINVQASESNEILVRAKVEAWGASAEEARDTLGKVKVKAEKGSVSAVGPGSGVSGWFNNGPKWSVSYEISVPAKQDLELKTVNGGVHVQGVHGKMKLETVNGGLDLAQVAGRIDGETVNGGVHVRLTGAKWEGEELNLHTVNGGVTLEVPESYNASLKAETVNGGMNSDFPGAKVTKNGAFGMGPKTMEQKLGDGGAPIHLETVNGGVHVQRKSA